LKPWKEKQDKMGKRFVTIWFRHLKTDWFARRQPPLKDKPFVLTQKDHGRRIVSAVNLHAVHAGIEEGMNAADARALVPSLEIMEDPPGLTERLLKKFAEWCIRFTDKVSIDFPSGLILDVTGCAPLWGDEKTYIRDINLRLTEMGYNVRATMADTIGAAWAIAHYGGKDPIIETGKHADVLLSLPPPALRFDPETTDRLYKLGLRQIRNIVQIPRASLKKRFGVEMIRRLDQALGLKEEIIVAVQPVEMIRERLPCPEPMVTAVAIEIALKRLLDSLCKRLEKENLGIRKLIFYCFRMDNKKETIQIGTHRGSRNPVHLFRLFNEKISSIEPGPGIELFMLEAPHTEKISSQQESLWETSTGFSHPSVAELIDRLSNRLGNDTLRRYFPDEHHWPERSFKAMAPDTVPVESKWVADRPRPLHLLSRPGRIEVAAPIPDYPPMHFRYNGNLHIIKKADGPERIEQEWWIQEGAHRDYYTVEDEQGGRYWIFRLGHYTEEKNPQWFIHGFFP